MTSSRDFGLGFLAGFLATVVVAIIVTIVILRRTDQYGLGHWKLNIKAPIRSMWMNVGYWKGAEGQAIQDFPEASAALLDEIVSTAGLDKSGANGSQRHVAILDLGFGCGDQTWHLTQAMHATTARFRYVGLSLNSDQVQSAQRRLFREVAAHPDMNERTLETIDLFCANAAKPETWSPKIVKAVESLSDETYDEKWLLALDCLYHFKPSRNPVFTYAATKLNANVMVFDLLLSDTASAMDVFWARVISVMMSCPVRTFMTETEYRDQLVRCGYDRETIVVKDITEHVFSGLVTFIHKQDVALAEYGISLGGFKLAQRLFDWFDRTGVVKAVIVVARTKGSS